MAFKFITPYRTRDGSLISVVFSCGTNVAVIVIVVLPFPTLTGSILDMNDNVLDMTKVNECPFTIDFRSPSKSTPVAGTHPTKVNEEQYGKFPKQLDEVDAHVYRSFSNPLVMGLQGGKKLRLAKNVNIDDTKGIKLNQKPNTTSTETPMVVSNGKQDGIPIMLETRCLSSDQLFLSEICQVLKITQATVWGKAWTLCARREYMEMWRAFAQSEAV